MKQKRLAPILAITLSLEMMLSPIVSYAQDESTASKINKAAEMTNTFIRAAGAVAGAANAAQGGNQAFGEASMQLQTLQGQMNAKLPDAKFNAQELMKIPGLNNYLAMNNINPAMLTCQTLPTEIHNFQPEVCRVGISTRASINPEAQKQLIQEFHKTYFNFAQHYSNYSKDSNVAGQGFGIGCMNNAMNILNGFFKYRLNELDKLATNLEAMQNQFKEASRSDLDAIEEAVAVLEGNSAIADKVRTKKPDLFDFSKRFNNPACNSMFAGETLNDLGRNTGLNSINRNVKALLTTKDGKYSGESYSQSHAAVVEDIQTVVDKIGKQVELNFNTKGSSEKDYLEFLKNVPGQVGSASGIQESIRMDSFADLTNKYTQQFAKIEDEKNLIAGELPGAEAALSKLGALNSSSFESEVNSIEKGIKNRCLASTIGDPQEIVKMLYDPGKSSHAETYGTSYLKSKLPGILSNPTTDLPTKLAEIRAAEAEEKNRYYLKMENSYQVQTLDANGNKVSKVVGAGTKRSTSVFVADLIQNCEAQFKSNKLGNKLTGASAIQKLRDLGTNFKNMAKSQAAEAKKELRKKLVECSSPEVANNTVPGSCSPQLFNTRTPGFCANAAFSCSKNMQACSKQAEAYTKEIKDQRTARVNNYKNLLEKNKQDIVKMFDTALAQYMKEGEVLRGLFGVGFSSPKGIQRQIPEGERYLDDIKAATGKQGSPDGKLLLEDPEKYVEMFHKNIDNLKQQVENQQNEILGGGGGRKDGLLAAHIENVKKNYSTAQSFANKMAKQCGDMNDKIAQDTQQADNKQQEEMMKTNKELGEQLPRFCKKFDNARENPNPACKGDIDDLIKSAYKAAAQSRNARVDTSAVTEFEEVCNITGGSNEGSATTLPPYNVMCDSLKDENGKYTNEVCTNLFVDRDITKSQYCVYPEKEINNSNNRNPLPDCTKAYEQLTAEYNHRFPRGIPGKSVKINAETAAPSFCSAGDNSARSSGKDANDPIEAFIKQMATRQ